MSKKKEKKTELDFSLCDKINEITEQVIQMEKPIDYGFTEYINFKIIENDYARLKRKEDEMWEMKKDFLKKCGTGIIIFAIIFSMFISYKWGYVA